MVGGVWMRSIPGGAADQKPCHDDHMGSQGLIEPHLRREIRIEGSETKCPALSGGLNRVSMSG